MWIQTKAQLQAISCGSGSKILSIFTTLLFRIQTLKNKERDQRTKMFCLYSEFSSRTVYCTYIFVSIFSKNTELFPSNFQQLISSKLVWSESKLGVNLWIRIQTVVASMQETIASKTKILVKETVHRKIHINLYSCFALS